MINKVRLIGIDPGMTGAVSWMDDGEFRGTFDMPTYKDGKRSSIDGMVLSEMLAGILYPDGYNGVRVIIERIQPIKHDNEKGGGARSQGVYSAGKMMEAYGIIQGVVNGRGFPCERIVPQQWKRAHNLLKTKKDEARLLAMALFPDAVPHLSLVKHGGRADALLLANFVWHRDNNMPVALPKEEAPF